MMKNDFEILSDFLSMSVPEASGRSSAELSDDLRTDIEQLAGGELPDDRRASLISAILGNEDALAFLAGRLRDRDLA